MEENFFRFPHTPHLAWLGEGLPREDKVLSSSDVSSLLKGNIVVEEKIDGANLGISISYDGAIRVQNRGQYLYPPFTKQFKRLESWIASHEYVLKQYLSPELILFGEWCVARHSLSYDNLPDWFVVFDIYDRNKQAFYSTIRRNELVANLGLNVVSTIIKGRLSLNDLIERLDKEQSNYYSGPLEGFVIRKENSNWLEARAKLVRRDFVQCIEKHWRHKIIEWNKLGYSKSKALKF